MVTRLDDEKYVQWSNDVKQKDNNKCQICCNVQDLHSHHLDGWNWCIEKRYDVDNGVTLCKPCHKTFHKIYGKGNNTKEEFTYWKENPITYDQYLKEKSKSISESISEVMKENKREEYTCEISASDLIEKYRKMRKNV